MDLPQQEPKVIKVTTINSVGAPWSYHIKTDTTVRQLKEMIKHFSGLPTTKQDLECNGMWLQDELTFDDYGIDFNVNINLVKKLDLWICKHKVEWSSYLMLVKENTTVAKLKEMIGEHFGEFYIGRLRDRHKGLLIEDDYTLRDYGITDYSHITYWGQIE